LTAAAAGDFGAYEPAAESTLSFADAPVAELRERVLRALRYTFSWADAVASNADPLDMIPSDFEVRVSQMQDALRALLNLLPPSDIFPGKDAVAVYEHTSESFAQLYRDLSTSLEGLPARPLLDELGDLGKAVFQAPAAAITAVAESATNAIARALGGTAAALWSNLWPWLLVAGGVGIVYVFRAPLGRVVAKVAA
jgi:hypothetical protein